MDKGEPRLTVLNRIAEERIGINLARGGAAQAIARYADQQASGPADLAPTAGQDVASAAFQALVRAVTVQHSWLLRDLQQLEVATASLRPGARVWVPACAKGEDPYSIALLMEAAGRPVEVLGTDICADALESARRAVYDSWATREVPQAHAPYLEGPEGRRAVTERVRRRVRFELHNLLDPPVRSPAPDGKWDLILCRNVLIYFSAHHSRRVIAALRDALAVGGALVLGASDILAELPPGLEPVVTNGRLTFRRTGAGAAAQPRAPSTVPRTLPRTLPSPPAPSPGRASTGSAARARAVPPDPLEVTGTGDPGEPPGDAAEADPSDASAAIGHMLEGIACHLAGELKTAAKELRTALYLMPRLWPASYYLALTYDGLGRCDEARREYEQVHRAIEARVRLPVIPGQDFSFLERDVAEIARRRAAPGGR